MITNQDWWPDQLNLKILRIFISVMAGMAISTSSPLFGQSVGDMLSVDIERKTRSDSRFTPLPAGALNSNASSLSWPIVFLLYTTQLELV